MLQNFAIKIAKLCHKNCKPLQSLFVSTAWTFSVKFLSFCAVIFLFNVLSNYLTVLLLRAFSHRVSKVDGAVVFYKAFSVRQWVQSLTKRKGKKYDETGGMYVY